MCAAVGSDVSDVGCGEAGADGHVVVLSAAGAATVADLAVVKASVVADAERRECCGD